eukprot:364562-Chlamydomonas_euryale.AAC.13
MGKGLGFKVEDFACVGCGGHGHGRGGSGWHGAHGQTRVTADRDLKERAKCETACVRWLKVAAIAEYRIQAIRLAVARSSTTWSNTEWSSVRCGHMTTARGPCSSMQPHAAA